MFVSGLTCIKVWFGLMSPEKGRIVGKKEMCSNEMEFLYADILGNIYKFR